MKIMKYKAETERQAMLLAKAELGSQALILSIKSVKPKGIWRYFRKSYVELTAALEEDRLSQAQENKDHQKAHRDQELAEFKSFLSRLSDKQRKTESRSQGWDQKQGHDPKDQDQGQGPSSPGQALAAQAQTQGRPELEPLDQDQTQARSTLIGQVIYEQLLENEVEVALADRLLQDLLSQNQDFSLEEGLNYVYRRLVKDLSDIKTISLGKGKAKPIFFIGSTGVGKTTTIAKLASLFTLDKKCKLALITADTYRIAAVEQLRTYANILNIPIRVIYKEEEIIDAIAGFADMDLIFIDTAGRSYQDRDHLAELKDLLNQVEDKQVYLVLSLSTKNSDLQKTVEAYAFTDFSLVFTKLDETLAYGSIYNISQKTGKALSYVTSGQNVPEDIAELDPYAVANKILGGVNS